MDMFKGIKQTLNPQKDLKNVYGAQNQPERNSANNINPTQKEEQMINNDDNSTTSQQEIEEKLENAVKNANMEIPPFDGSDEVIAEEANTLKNEIDALEFKLDETEQERDKLKDQLLRLQAEFENQRRRFQKERADLIEYANEKLLLKFLEIPDTIALGLDAAKKATDSSSIITGLEMIQTKTQKLFEEAGVKLMEDPTGKEFNVNIHEAISTSPSQDIPEGNVAIVYQNGYFLGEKVLRHAKVVTSSGNE